MSEQYDLLMNDAEIAIKKIDLNKLNNKTVLITGASGLIGLHLLCSLRKWIENKNQKTRVIAVFQSQPEKYLSEILDHKYFSFVRGDLSNPNFCDKLPEVDYIIHAAGYGQPGMFMEDQIKTIQLNTTTTMNLFKKLNKDGGFLFLSTSEVYSGSSSLPHYESDIGTTHPDHIRACYIEGKRCGEAVCGVYRNQGINAKSVRLCLTYGTGTKINDKRVINNFIQKALVEKEIKMLDNGESMRSYIYVSDVIEMIWNILLYGKYNVYNIGGQQITTILDLANNIGDLLNIPVLKPIKSKTLNGSPQHVYIDTVRYKNEFNKKDFIELKEGLKKTIEWQNLLYK